MSFEVLEPILNSPFAEPREHWHIAHGETPERRTGRRNAMYHYRDPRTPVDRGPEAAQVGVTIELKLVNRIRDALKRWRELGYPGATRTTLELLSWWQRDGRKQNLFFAQLEAAETVIFLVEARADLRQGIDVPRDQPSDRQQDEGYAGFMRYACKMATGSGKTTVMGMLAAWSILNKVNDRSDKRFSDVVLVVCPNVTIRDRLRELDPQGGESSLYRTRDLVPPHLMASLAQGRVLVMNWHGFELQRPTVNGVSARVTRIGVVRRVKKRIVIAAKNTSARGRSYLTQEALEQQVDLKLLEVLSEERDRSGNLKWVEVETEDFVESDTAFVHRVLGREIGGKGNLLVLNDEAHHAYRIRPEEKDEFEDDLFGEDEEAEEFFKEATVWMDGLDRIARQRGIHFCVDFSATPYYLGRVGQAANRPFPWVVSDFGLIEAIESGLVKIPQLAVRDTTGSQIPGYFNIWQWILPQLTPAERGGKKASPKPEAILKYAHHPFAMLAGLWEQQLEEWRLQNEDPRPPVFIVVCKNTQIAKVIFEWLAEDNAPAGIPPAKIEGFKNSETVKYTIRVDSKVTHEIDTGVAKSDETRWMRFTLDTVGKLHWPKDRQGRTLYPDGFEDLARKLNRSLHPPGRDVRCIISVGMLTEGWDCNTVTHIIGLRPFMSQLLCEQVVGRGLRRVSYEPGANGLLNEEVAKVFGVPFEIIPFKANQGVSNTPPIKRHHVRALPNRAVLEIQFPRVEGYTQAIRNRVQVNWSSIPPLRLEPDRIPPEVQVKGLHQSADGGLSLLGPGRLDQISLKEFRSSHRLQELVFTLARDLSRQYLKQDDCVIPVHALFPQLARIVEQYLETRVEVQPPADLKDIFLAPYYGWLLERLLEAIRPGEDEAPEVPRFEANRGAGSTADVDFWTGREVREVQRSHVNYVVADTERWEQTAAYYLDTHPAVTAFGKNAGLGFAIPYAFNGAMHDYLPDFIVRLNLANANYVILETKGYDPLTEVKQAAALRWVAAVNAHGKHGTWQYAIAKRPTQVNGILDDAVAQSFTLALNSTETIQ
jgi:type III restriction enzyme